MINLDNFLATKEKLSKTFEKRKNYQNYTEQFFEQMANNSLSKNEIDSTSVRNLYGKVNRTGDFIISNPEKIIKMEKMGKVLWGFDFVLDAFSELKNYYDPVSKNNGWNSYLNPVSLEKKQDVVTSFHEVFLKNKIFDTNNRIRQQKPDSFSLTFSEYEKLFFKNISIEQISYESYLKTSNFPPAETNLTIILSQNSINNDQAKIEDFWETIQYKFLVEAARRFGFLVDSFAPWRLTVDLNSTATSYFIQRRLELNKIKEQGFTDNALGEFLEKFSPTSPSYMNVPKIHIDNIFEMYFILADEQFQKEKDCILDSAFNSL